MSLIHTAFDRPVGDDIAKSLGNMLLSGVAHDGQRNAFFDLLELQMKGGRTCVLLQDAVTEGEHNTVIGKAAPYITGTRSIYELSLSSGGAYRVDALTVFPTAADKADFLLSLLSLVADVPEALKAKMHSFFYYAIDTYDVTCTPYKLSDLMHLDPDTLMMSVDTSALSAFEKGRRLRFLGDSKTREAFLDMESYMVQLEESGICDLYSGTDSFCDVVGKGNFVTVTGYAREETRRRSLLLSSFLLLLRAAMEACVATAPCSVVLTNFDFVKKEELEALLTYHESVDCVTYTVLDDVARYAEKNGNGIFDNIKSFMVFTQGSDKNASFWSGLFGSREVQERSYSYMRRKSWNPFSLGMDNGGVIATPKQYKTETTSMHKVEKPIYSPEIFRTLQTNEAMCYLREPLIRKKVRF